MSLLIKKKKKGVISIWILGGHFCQPNQGFFYNSIKDLEVTFEFQISQRNANLC